MSDHIANLPVKCVRFNEFGNITEIEFFDVHPISPEDLHDFTGQYHQLHRAGYSALRDEKAKLTAVRELIDNTASVDLDELPMKIGWILDGKT